MLKGLVAKFARSESGAVTVDWVVLTAGIVGLGLATLGVVSGGVSDLSSDSSATMESMEIQSSFNEAQEVCSSWGSCVSDDDGDGIADTWVPQPGASPIDISGDGYTMEQLNDWGYS